MADYTRQLKKYLTENGCSFHRQGKGSHEIWYSPVSKQYFPIPVKHLRSRSTANGVLKQAGLEKAF